MNTWQELPSVKTLIYVEQWSRTPQLMLLIFILYELNVKKINNKYLGVRLQMINGREIKYLLAIQLDYVFMLCGQEF